MISKDDRFLQDLDHEWLRKLDFEDVTAEELLTRMKDQYPIPKKRKSAWVFDIDSTLLAVGPRIRAIYIEFLRQHDRPPIHWQQALNFMNPRRQPYNIELGFKTIFDEMDSQKSRDWARELWDEFLPFWQEHFFSNRFLTYDEPYPGAVEFVERVSALGHEIVYLTGRDRPRCGHGTRLSLKKSGFPLHDHCLLLMKEDPVEADLDYKEKTSALIKSRFEAQLFIDNEPENIVMFARKFPKSQIVFFHTVMSDRVPTANFQHLLGDRKLLRLQNFT